MPYRQAFKLFIRTNAKLKHKLKSELFSDLLSAPINLAFSIYQKILYKDLPDGYTLKPLNSVPEQVDTFIDENCKQIHVQRTKKYLDWRFINNPRRKFIILGLYLDNKLIGVSFSLLQKSTVSKQKDGFLIDWAYDQFSDLSDRGALKKEKPNSIMSSAYDVSFSKGYHKLGFIKKDYKQTFFTHTSDKNLEQYLYNNKLLHLTESDADTDLF